MTSRLIDRIDRIARIDRIDRIDRPNDVAARHDVLKVAGVVPAAVFRLRRLHAALTPVIGGGALFRPQGLRAFGNESGSVPGLLYSAYRRQSRVQPQCSRAIAAPASMPAPLQFRCGMGE